MRRDFEALKELTYRRRKVIRVFTLFIIISEMGTLNNS